MQLRNPISLHDELIKFFWCLASRPLRDTFFLKIESPWRRAAGLLTLTRASPFAILTPRSWSNNPRLTQTHEGTTRLRTEDIWLNPNKGENLMKESYWASWVLEAKRPVQLTQLGLEWPSTHQCTIQKIPFWDSMDGMKLSPRGQFTWSVFLFFFCSFFSQLDFFP
jgi:hypothetical protein